MIIRLEFISRRVVRINPNCLFVFGDNMVGRGYGGQAKEMRGEPNTVGIPTKWRPGTDESDYFTVDDWHTDRNVYHAIHEAFGEIQKALDAGRPVIIPIDGIGTGRAELHKRVPDLARYIEQQIKLWEDMK